ncbi:MAG: F0F1 ATP synthase subunit delta [Thermomicrobiales bacterium]|nr:F0F1 ATP synthase subunit delta [Thermomicrobiales bacterium]
MASSAAKRYVQALTDIAQESNTFDAWQRDLDTLAAVVSDSEVLSFLESPSVQEAQKLSAVDTVLKDAQPEAHNLFRMMIERRRLRLLPEISELFSEEVLASKGIVMVDVTTADALDDAGEQLVRERLKGIVGKDVELRLHTDANIIGGIVARIGDQVIDGSVLNQLRRLRASLNAVR